METNSLTLNLLLFYTPFLSSPIFLTNFKTLQLIGSHSVPYFLVQSVSLFVIIIINPRSILYLSLQLPFTSQYLNVHHYLTLLILRLLSRRFFKSPMASDSLSQPLPLISNVSMLRFTLMTSLSCFASFSRRPLLFLPSLYSRDVLLSLWRSLVLSRYFSFPFSPVCSRFMRDFQETAPPLSYKSVFSFLLQSSLTSTCLLSCLSSRLVLNAAPAGR